MWLVLSLTRFLSISDEPRREKTGLRGFRQGLTQTGLYSLRKNNNRILKFLVYVEEELYYPCSENKDAEQLCSYCIADLRLCLRIGNNPAFS